MSRFTVLINKPAEKDLESLNIPDIKKIREKLTQLSENPFPQGFKKLHHAQYQKDPVRKPIVPETIYHPDIKF